MSYNPYGGGPYGPPPSYGGFPGSTGAPGMAPPPGLGPPPGMSSAPGMAPPPGIQQANAAQANRPSGLPASFQAPPNMPNINFNAPVIRLGTVQPKPGGPSTSAGGRKDSDNPLPGGPGGRPGLGMDRGGPGAERGLEQSRAAMRETMQSLVPPTNEEKLRTVFVHRIPDGVGGDKGVERILGAVGKLRRWDPAASVFDDRKGQKFGFAQFEDVESLETAVELLKEVDVPAKKQVPSIDTKDKDKDEDKDKREDGDADKKDKDGEEKTDGVEKAKFRISVDQNSVNYLESLKHSRDDAAAEARLAAARTALEEVLHELFFPKAAPATDAEGDVAMANGTNAAGATGENVEVVNIPLAQDDELADIPAEMREVVASEIAAFRDRSNKRDMERLKREEEIEQMDRLERQANGNSRSSRLDSPGAAGSNNVPQGPRGARDAPSGPRGGHQNGRSVSFTNGGVSNADFSIHREDEDTDASDDELNRRQLAKQRDEDDKAYLEAERKWVNRERSRAAALERERDRERQEAETFERRRQEQLAREKEWDDEREAARKAHPYYRDRAAWVRKRATERADEEARDGADRRAEADERRRAAAEMEQARGMADSFLDQQAREITQQRARQEEAAAAAAAAAPQPFKLSLGAAAQRAQAQRAAPARRTIADVEGLLDDEDGEGTTRRQLVPMQLEPLTGADAMSEEEIGRAVRALAQEIPSEKDGLWAWEVQWDHLEDGIVREKLRPFVEKKIVEYLGVQEQMLVEAVEEHLRRHGKPGELVEELSEAMDEEAEDLVKKLWRMLIFFTESEKRGLPA